MMFVGVGAVMSIAPTIGTLVGTNAETQPAHMIGSYVSGLMHDASTVFFSLNSATSSSVKITFP